MRPSISGRMMTDSSAIKQPTAETSSETFATFTASALTGSPCGWAAGVAGCCGAGFAASAFWPAVASFFEPQPAISAAVTSAVRMATLRIIGVCTCLPLDSGRGRKTAGFDWWRKNRQRGLLAGNRPPCGHFKYGAPADGFILLTDESFIFQHHNRVLLPPP